MNHDDRLIVALDFPTMEQAKAVVLELGDNVSHYKVGMELYYAAGSEMIRFLKGHNKQVFLDLKLQDIPNTVAGALAVLTGLGADMMNVHAVGGKKMMQAAVKSVREAAAKLGRPAPKLIAVTILTSMEMSSLVILIIRTLLQSRLLLWQSWHRKLGWMVSLPRHRKLQVFEVPVVPSF